MQNALLVGLSRQVALAREMDVIANNLANMAIVPQPKRIGSRIPCSLSRYG